MELYKLIATINNTAETYEFDFIPENFDGAKITQQFSFINPIGYTPKFSLDTMRIIKGDKTAIDAVFDAYGLESDVEIEVQKLKTNGYQYEYNSTFAIDFESYEKFDVYSEFALKSVSVIDYYNNIKNVEKIFDLPLRSNINGTRQYLPSTQNLINFVSLKNNLYNSVTANSIIFVFQENNQSKIFNNDTALLDTAMTEIYKIGDETTKNIRVKATISFLVTANQNINTLGVSINNHIGGTSYGSYPIVTYSGINATTKRVEASFDYEIESPFVTDSVFDVVMTIAGYSGGISILSVEGSLFIDLKRDANLKAVEANQYIYFDRCSNIINSIFNSNAVYNSILDDAQITSANCITGLNQTAAIKPKDLLSDICIGLGLILNFKLDGSIQLEQFGQYFSDLLDVANAVEITDFKDLSIKHSIDLNMKGVTVGSEPNTYDIFTYLIDWNKKLTFEQLNRNAIEVLDLSFQKLRTDFSGILDYYYKRSSQDNKNSNDVFLYINEGRTTGSGDVCYDSFTPRDVLIAWKRFLSFYFQNFSKNTLTISSNGGTVDNLEISGVAQMDDLVLNETPRLLPIEYNFTALLPEIDFSEKILKINDNGTDVYIFVVNAETTDTLSEQKIRGLKIQL